VIVKARAA